MGGKGSGRKPKSANRALTEQKLAETSPEAAKYLALVAVGEEKGDPSRVDVCKYIINQDIGSPTQKTVIAGDEESPFTVVWDAIKQS